MLTDKVIVVTGGAGLLGKTFCNSILENNGYVIIAELSEEKGFEVQTEFIQKFGDERVLFQKVDITSKESIVSLITTVKSKYGKIDALVNNAYPKNKNYGKHFFNVEYDDFCENICMHLGGYFLVSQQFARFMVEQGYGNIVNISSIYGVIAPRFEIYKSTSMTTPIEYIVTKSALIHLSKYMAKYLKNSGIRINSISPGGIYDHQPESFLMAYKLLSTSKGILDKSDITGTLVFLLSDNSKFINGQNIIVDDGFSL